MLPKLFLVSFCLIPIVVFLHQIHRHRQRLRQTVKSPFTDLLLRPAGESLRLKIRELEGYGLGSVYFYHPLR